MDPRTSRVRRELKRQSDAGWGAGREELRVAERKLWEASGVWDAKNFERHSSRKGGVGRGGRREGGRGIEGGTGGLTNTHVLSH